MSWGRKLKSLFIETDGAPGPAGSPSGQTLPEGDLAAMEAQVARDLAALELPSGQVGALGASTDPAKLAGTIDFQSLYDEAGVPNTDEVEQLEKFLNQLDDTMPQASRLAAAKAFLSAVGKAPQNVVDDAARKIEVVRAVGAAKQGESDTRLTDLQSQIDSLQEQIESCRSQMQSVHGELESVKAQCASEEGRLQAARIFFGHLGAVGTSASSGKIT